MNKFKKIEEAVLKIWKDPVWSKVISAGIILLIATLWAKYNNYSSQQIYNFVIFILSYKFPVFVFLSIVGAYFLIKLVIRLFKRKIDPIWDEQVGNYKFKELYKILSSQNLPVGTNGMGWSGQKPPEEDLLTMFHTYSTFFNKGINLDDDYQDGGYLYGVLAPKLVGYGLLDKIETKNLQIDFMDIKYQTSEVGQKFFALLEKSIHILPND
jgi:hypothetical protein